MSALWPKCRHADPKGGPSLCQLPPGVLVCPCLGSQQQGHVAEVLVDSEGQLVWRALGPNDQPTAFYTFLAKRRDATGAEEFVKLQPAPALHISTQAGQGHFLVHDHLGQPHTLSTEEFMTRALDGDEFVQIR